LLNSEDKSRSEFLTAKSCKPHFENWATPLVSLSSCLLRDLGWVAGQVLTLDKTTDGYMLLRLQRE
jgi:hypothetical protein